MFGMSGGDTALVIAIAIIALSITTISVAKSIMSIKVAKYRASTYEGNSKQVDNG